MKRLILSLSFLSLIFIAGGANAITITDTSVTLDTGDVGESFTVEFDGNVEEDDVDGLTAEATFTLASIMDEMWTFGVDLSNTSTAPIDASRVSALGFDTDPDLTDAEVVSGIFDNAILDGSLPNQFGDIEVCFTDGNTCSGGQSGGVTLGNDGSFDIKLTFPVATTSVTLSNFGVRYQSIDSSTLNLSGASGTGTGTPDDDGGGPPTEVPEPSILFLFGSGLLGLLYIRRRYD